MEHTKASVPPDASTAAGKYDYMKSKTEEELLEELIFKIMLLNAEELDEFIEKAGLALSKSAECPAKEMRPGA